MSIATKSPQQGQPGPSGPPGPSANRRIWRVPLSRAWWIGLLSCLLFYAAIYVWYLYAIKTQPFPGPFTDPLRTFGVIAFVLVLGTAAYSLRRRFIRNLPGKAQVWLWLHIWLGITAVLIAFLHVNYAHILNNYCGDLTCFTRADAGTSALYALIILVVSGIVGRLLDLWQTHVIAQDASSNGVGIVRAIEERLLESEYTIERLCAGKSEPFKHYCLLALEGQQSLTPSIPPSEQADFQRAYDALSTHARLTQSLHTQKRARTIIATWRVVHITIACLALLVILYHGGTELLTNVLHV
ncbi:MAG TPA: hypothetical protein VKR83_15095 [Ktedonobacteraceae bacterium]|nr:hypothetical protein [Ktedonobacteraceae bacterium]